MVHLGCLALEEGYLKVTMWGVHGMDSRMSNHYFKAQHRIDDQFYPLQLIYWKDQASPEHLPAPAELLEHFSQVASFPSQLQVFIHPPSMLA